MEDFFWNQILLDCLCFPVVYTVLWLILLLDFT